MSELGKPTRGERLLVTRRRLGVTQVDAAELHDTTRSMYAKWERDIVPGPHVKIGRLEPHERCLLYRRRAGFTQAQVAEGLEMCRYWVNLMETGQAPCDNLLWFWEQ